MKSMARKWIERRDSDPTIGVAYNWNKRILVVDDEPEIRETYKDVLSPTNKKVLPIRSSRSAILPPNEVDPGFEFDVTLCSSYKEAIEVFRLAREEGRPYAMGFFDVMLGSSKDGYDLVKELHQDDPHLYAVFVTAYNDRSIESINSLLGVKMVDRWDYINKPFTQGEILQKARNFVTLWNLEKEGDLKSVQLAEAQNRLLESERTVAVAAVARGVTHEFGNILMQIMGKADIARKKPPAEMQQALERIVEASQRASDILEKFKNLSTTEESINRRDWFFLHHILEEALDLLEHQFKVANMKVTIIKKDTVKLRAYSTSLLQLIINLSINAIHAMGNSG
ncbi:MAG: response regulator, partial [Bdellovibrionales bacterium]|nr:response regulator [Bdellovibrionales bacterium]